VPPPPSSAALKKPSVPPPAPPASSPAVSEKPSTPAPDLEVVEVVEMSEDALTESVSTPTPDVPPAQAGNPRNEALVAALKKIVKLSRNGRAEDAYAEYTSLFSSATFADYRPEDQRHALKLMVHSNGPTASKNATASAHRAAMERLKVLTAAIGDPADYEMLGMTYLHLEDEKAASAAFQTALTIERSRNPQSELIATLMRRVSQI
jgi:hypothetical protein